MLRIGQLLKLVLLIVELSKIASFNIHSLNTMLSKYELLIIVPENLQLLNSTLLNVDFSKFTPVKSQFSNIESHMSILGNDDPIKDTFLNLEFSIWSSSKLKFCKRSSVMLKPLIWSWFSRKIPVHIIYLMNLKFLV